MNVEPVGVECVWVGVEFLQVVDDLSGEGNHHSLADVQSVVLDILLAFAVDSVQVKTRYYFPLLSKPAKSFYWKNDSH